MKKAIPYIVTILITVLVTILIIKGPVRCTQQSGHNIQSDTVVYHDTIPYYEPVAQIVKDNGKTQVSVSVRDLKEALSTLPPIRADTPHDTAMAMRGEQARGWSAHVSLNSSITSKTFARSLIKAAEAEGLKIRKYSNTQPFWPQNLAICRDTNCPAVLTENLFQDNEEDVAYLLSEEGKRTITNIHVNGIIDFMS